MHLIARGVPRLEGIQRRSEGEGGPRGQSARLFPVHAAIIGGREGVIHHRRARAGVVGHRKVGGYGKDGRFGIVDPDAEALHYLVAGGVLRDEGVKGRSDREGGAGGQSGHLP